MSQSTDNTSFEHGSGKPPAANLAPHNLTPAMERYLQVKKQNPGSIMLFRMGDFYELFFEDAVTSSKVLGLTLTSRDKGSPNPIPR